MKKKKKKKNNKKKNKNKIKEKNIKTKPIIDIVKEFLEY